MPTPPPSAAALPADDPRTIIADSPMRAKVDQDDVTGLKLFEQDLFAVGTAVDADGKVRSVERSATDLLADLDADQSAIDALKACLE